MRHHRTTRSAVLRVVALAAVGSLALTACGGGDDSPSADGSGGGDEKVSIRFSWWGSDTRHTLTQDVIKDFEALHPNITVVADYTDWDSYFDKLSTAVAGGDAPDVITQEERFLTDYASRGVLADLNELGLDTSKIDKSVLQSGTIDGKLYGVATGINAYVVVADPEAFKAAGVALPDDKTWSWDDYVSTADEISKKSDGKIIGAQDYGSNEAGFSIFARQQGQSLYKPDGSLGYDDATLAAWWQHSIDLQNSGGQPKAAASVELGNAGPEQSLIGTGKGAMAWYWTNQLTAITNAAGHPLQLLRVPGETGNERTGMYFKPAMFYSVSAKSKHPKESQLLVDYLINSEAAGKKILSDRGLPANTDVRTAVTPDFNDTDKQAAAFLAELGSDVVDGPAVPPNGAGEVADITQRINQEVLFEQLSPAEAAEQFTQEVTSATSK
ncbi:ABC transporter substrate-binding protein [Cellulomonas sp. PhB150]|uniref:ABC transporter substrate-binding protein n=1 Tax=Cellulomonas sp. PhB150 TaxID=2485188 RepID=UPI000F478343|nr:ABC transporter substrate-binding protein [Cellulomonas sp. PhB150]ROS31800.1 carbohydrate ABC transporter substrate-binding protein (CUT1 family) [Cellulomonas sp. PhB150]